MSMVDKCVNGEVMSAEKQIVSNVIDLYNRYESVAIGAIAAANLGIIIRYLIITDEAEANRMCSFISNLFDDWYKVKNKKEG